MKSHIDFSPGIGSIMALAVFLAGNLFFTGAVFAETLYVKKSKTKLLAKGSAKSLVMKRLAIGTPVEVKDKPGRFYKVSVAGTEGFVFKFKLSRTMPDRAEKDRRSASGESISRLSIHRIGSMTEEQAKKMGISLESILEIKRMEEFKVSPSEVEQFIAQRKLGEYSD